MIKSWVVKRDDGRLLLNKNSTPKLFRVRAEAKSAADKAKGVAKPQRVEIAEV